jgi:endonuclease G, mitochondrial
MSVLNDQINKARARQEGEDIASVVDAARGKAPVDLATPQQKRDRLAFLETCELPSGDTPQEVFERIIAGNEIQDVNYLARGARVAQAICRVTIKDEVGRTLGLGTGFLIAPNVLLTNNHVLPSSVIAGRSVAEFSYELDIAGQPATPVRFSFDAQRLFITNVDLDYSVVAVRSVSDDGGTQLSSYGILPLVQVTGKVADGEWLTIVQHPNGERKQLCVRENKLIKRTPDVLWYSTDTLGGSSGSPVFNNEWYVVALHHSGIPETKNGRMQTRNGTDYDPSRHDDFAIKWIANEGIRVSRIVQTLQSSLPKHPLLIAIFEAKPEYTDMPWIPSANETTIPTQPQSDRSVIMSEQSRSITVTLSIAPDGRVSLAGAGAAESLFLEKAATKKEVNYDVPFNSDYTDRKGFNSKFLSNKPEHQTWLPEIDEATEEVVTKLLKPKPDNKYVLQYHNYSAVMHSTRKFAIYTAANLNSGGRWDLGRPTDVWRWDPRIPRDAQIGDAYYKSNQFDRGHLTRREDLEFGDTFMDALISAADTCHWVNCTPQHSRFNQNKELWQGIERHIFEEAIWQNQFKAQVYTGPVLDEGDPTYKKFPKIQYPVRFWKVVAAVNAAGELFATAYILDQTDVITEFGIEAAQEIPFSAYKTFQVSIKEVERLTGLRFLYGKSKASMSECDPLKNKKIKQKKPSSLLEAASMSLQPPGYLELQSFDEIVTK